LRQFHRSDPNLPVVNLKHHHRHDSLGVCHRPQNSVVVANVLKVVDVLADEAKIRAVDEENVGALRVAQPDPS